MDAAVGIVIIAVIVGVWYLAEHVFDEAFDALWTGIGRLFRRAPKAPGDTKTGSTGLLMSREDAIDEGEGSV